MKKTLLVFATSACALLLSNCASFTSPQRLADYNNDGIISPAEYQQNMTQQNVTDRNIYTENNKRKNVLETIRDTTRSVEGFQDLLGAFGVKELGGARGADRRKYNSMPY